MDNEKELNKENKDKLETKPSEIANDDKGFYEPKPGKRGSPEWRPDYFNDLVEYYADPSETRTIKAFAEEHGVIGDTIHTYVKKHGKELFEVVDKVRSLYIPRIRSAALAAVFRNVNKSFNDRRLALQYTGDLVERVMSDSTIRTPEEKRKRIALETRTTIEQMQHNRYYQQLEK